LRDDSQTFQTFPIACYTENEGRIQIRKNIKRILISVFALTLFGCGIPAKNSIRRNETGINQAYLGCLMYSSDILKCQDLRWGAMLALSNMKQPSTVSIEDLKKATPVKVK
jgi:starvation-inducible outer membrane lipoprotein